MAAGDRIRPVRTPFAVGFTGLNAIEYTAKIVTHGTGGFRGNFNYFGMTGSGAFYTTITSTNPLCENDAFGNISVTPGLGISTNSQYEGIAPVVAADGLQIRIDPNTAPRYARIFSNGDGLGSCWKIITARDQLPVPSTITWRAICVGEVTDPVNNISRKITGEWLQLIGDFMVWEVKTTLNGVYQDVGTFFTPKAKTEYLQAALPLAFLPEWFEPLAAQAVDIRYSGCRVFDATTGTWHELLDWQIDQNLVTADPDHGWSVHEEDGTLASICGVATNENVIGRYMLAGLTYEDFRTGAYAALPFFAVEDRTHGGILYNGPTWRVFNEPYVKQDADRGFYVMHPANTVPVNIKYVAPVDGTYRFVGDFARAHGTIGLGDGVDVSIVSDGETLFSAHVVDTEAVDATSATTMFAGASNQTFDVTKTLTAGAVTRFIADAGVTPDADPTAFRVLISFVKTPEVRTPVAKGDPFFVPRGSLYSSRFDSVGERPRRLLGNNGLRHEVFYFSDADDGEIWRSCPDGIVAVAIGQSESDASSDVQAFVNEDNQIEVASGAGNRKLWLHVWRRASLRPSTTGTDVPPEDTGLGSLPRGTGVFTNDLTLAGDNLNNGRIVNFHGYAHRVYGFRDIKNGDTFVGKSGIVATAFQHAYPAKSFVKTKITARTNRSTTIQFDTTNVAYIDGWLHVWSKT